MKKGKVIDTWTNGVSHESLKISSSRLVGEE